MGFSVAVPHDVVRRALAAMAFPPFLMESLSGPERFKIDEQMSRSVM